MRITDPRPTFLITCLALLATGCSPCAFSEEDEDADGLSCEMEIELGTDPTLSDSDQDGYRDGDEVIEGSDPTDATSLIYTGGWPYNPNKDSIDFPGWDTTAEVGAQLPHFEAVDQYGDIVDMYDFSGHDRPIILDMGTIWCAPCKGMAAYLSDGDTAHVEEYAWWESEYEGLYDAVRDGDIFWVTVLFSAGGAGPADQSHSEQWHEAYPNPQIPVLADEGLDLYNWIDVSAYPVLNLLDADFDLEIYQNSGPYSVLRELPDIL
jgi:thiol-disulfide isomerase/thioredoxin